MAKSKYKEGEFILCYQGPLIYEAKVQGVAKGLSGEWMYDIHYKGWNKTWDEWVGDERILKMNSDNLQRQKEIADTHKKKDKDDKEENVKTFAAKKTGGSASVDAQKRKAAIDARIANKELVSLEERYIDDKCTADDEKKGKSKKSKPLSETEIEKAVAGPSEKKKVKSGDSKVKSNKTKADLPKKKVKKKVSANGEEIPATNKLQIKNPLDPDAKKAGKKLKRKGSVDSAASSLDVVAPAKKTKRSDSSDSASNNVQSGKKSKGKDASDADKKSKTKIGATSIDSDSKSKQVSANKKSKTTVKSASEIKNAPPVKKSHKKKATPADTKNAPPVKKSHKKKVTPAETKNAPPVKKSHKKKVPPTSICAAPSKSGKALAKKNGQQVNPLPDTFIIRAQNKPYGKKEVVINIPNELKPILVDDWDYIGRQRKLLIIPARYTVEDLLNDYAREREFHAPDTHSKQFSFLGAQEVAVGLKEYFNSTLGSQLLYKFERIQYADILKDQPGVPMCQIYGTLHLLRLFTKVGAMLTVAELDRKSLELLIIHLHDFLAYVKKHKQHLFQIEDYGTATPEYHRRAL